jgi:8-oxo-dGTP diphosphatase
MINPEPLADFKVGVDNVIFAVDLVLNRLLVLLIERTEDPFAGSWSLPGTLVRQGESLAAAADRILIEKITLEKHTIADLYLEQLYSFGGPGRDPREAKSSYGERYLSVSYFALVRFEAAELAIGGTWHSIASLPTLAFDHQEIVNYGMRRLRSKLEYSPIAFDVLPTEFTLHDVYQLYTIVLGNGFSDYSNFRNRLLKLGFLTETDRKISKGSGRPASLYRFNPVAFEPLKDRPLLFV